MDGEKDPPSKDIIEEICLRLPPKDLVRFRAVHPSWRAVISSRSFINKHLRYHQKRTSSSQSLVVHYHDTNLEKHLASLTVDEDSMTDNNILSCLVQDIDVTRFPGIHADGLWSCIHSNGIIAISSNVSKRTMIYNPAIRDVLVLPPAELYAQYRIRAFGFGLGTKADVYKFIRIVHDDLKKKLCYAQVYTLHLNIWSTINLDFEIPTYSEHWNGVCHEGIYFWMLPSEEPLHKILGFDLSHDSFHTITLPDSFQISMSPIRRRLTVWNERLGLLHHHESLTFFFDLWVMDKPVEVAASWSKHARIELPSSVAPPIRDLSAALFWKKNQLLISTFEGRLIFYNLDTNEVRELPVHGREYGGYRCVFYVESMVPVNNTWV